MRICFTEHSGHGIALSRQLLEQGFDLIVAAGGDGTINEVANGFIQADQPISRTACLAVLPLGTGGDFRRTLGISSNLAEAIAVLTTGAPLQIDVGKAVFAAPNGTRQTRYFVNVVSFGMGGEVASRAKNIFSPLGGSIAFLYATAAVFFRYRAKHVSLKMDGAESLLSLDITNIAVGNGRFHGGGMQVCPRAVLNDGALEITVIDYLRTLEVMKDLPVLYSTDIYRHPKVRHFRAARIVAEASEPTLIEIDGEPLGKLPLEIRLLPLCLRVMVSRSSPLLARP